MLENLYEDGKNFVKDHPVVSAAIGAAAGYGLYKGGKFILDETGILDSPAGADVMSEMADAFGI